MKYRFKSFTLHKLDAHITDVFIAEYNDSLFLLDCGCRSDHRVIVDYITQTIRRPINDLRLLVVTHPHPDHSGSAMSLSSEYGIAVAAPENMNLWYRGIRGGIQHLIDMFLAHLSARSRKMKLRRISFPKIIRTDYPLNDLSPLPFFPDWQVYSVPGHTEFDMVLYNSKESFLYCSDTIVKIREKFLPPFPVSDRVKMSESLTKIGELHVETLAMAHGGVYRVKDYPALISELKTGLDRPLTGSLKFFHPLTLFPEPLKKKK